MRRQAVAVLALLALAGCGTGSNTGLAARVGDQVISSGRLGDDVAQTLGLAQFRAGDVDRTAIARDRLTTLIYRKLADVAARRLGLTITAAQVDERVQELVDNFGSLAALEQAAAQSDTPKEDLREALRAGLVQERIRLKLVEDVPVGEEQLRTAYQQNSERFDRVQVWHIQVRTEAEAEQALQRVRAGEDFGSLAGTLSVDGDSRERGGFLGLVGRGVLDPAIDRAVFAGAEGAVTGPVRSSKGWHVLKIGKRRFTPLAAAGEQLRLVLLDQQMRTRSEEYLTGIAKTLRITVSPRFGRWDPERLAVVPPRDDLSSPPPGPGAPGPDAVPSGPPQPAPSP